MGLSVIGSIFNITGIAVNRYCYICHSFSYSRLYSYRNTLMFVALIWLLTVVAIVPNFFVGSLRYDPRVYSCTFAQNVSSSYTVAVVVVHFLVPIAVVTFCYLRIWVLVIQVSVGALCMYVYGLKNRLNEQAFRIAQYHQLNQAVNVTPDLNNTETPSRSSRLESVENMLILCSELLTLYN